MTFESFLDQVYHLSPENERCTVTFDRDGITAVRCKTCGKYPTSIMCMDCFDPELHKVCEKRVISSVGPRLLLRKGVCGRKLRLW